MVVAADIVAGDTAVAVTAAVVTLVVVVVISVALVISVAPVISVSGGQFGGSGLHFGGSGFHSTAHVASLRVIHARTFTVPATHESTEIIVPSHNEVTSHDHGLKLHHVHCGHSVYGVHNRLVAHLQCVPALYAVPQNQVLTESLVSTNSLMPINYYIPQTQSVGTSMLSGSAEYEEYYFNPFGWMFNIFRHHKHPKQLQQQWQYVMLPPWAYYYPYYYSQYPTPYSTAGASLVPLGSTVTENQTGVGGGSNLEPLNTAGTADAVDHFANGPELPQSQFPSITSGASSSESLLNQNPLRIHLRGTASGDSAFQKMWSQPEPNSTP